MLNNNKNIVNLEKFKGKDLSDLTYGMNPLNAFTLRLDILTPLEPNHISSLLDNAYTEAESKANKIIPKIKTESDTMLRIMQEMDYTSNMPPPLSEKEEYMEGPEGPPLTKGKIYMDCVVHEVIKSILVRDYDLPHGDWAYSKVRERLSHSNRDMAEFLIFPYDKDSEVCTFENKIYNQFKFEPKSDLILLKFIFASMNLYGNYSHNALEAKAIGITPTTEESKTQIDALEKLNNLLINNYIPFYVTAWNPRNSRLFLIHSKENIEKTNL